MKLHVFASLEAIEPLINWLESRCGVDAKAIGCIIHEMGDRATLASLFPWAQLQCFDAIDGVIAKGDAILVAGKDVATKIGRLFARGFNHIYDGNVAMLAEGDPVGRLRAKAGNSFVGPVPPTGFDPGARDALRFHRDPQRTGQIAPHLLFVINSLPKSGSMWLAGILAEAMGLVSSEQMVVSHVADIEQDAVKWNVQGAVLLVRDMRDVVVSWFHDMQRSDLSSGFARPRYENIDCFYREFFLGTMRASDRYYRGALVEWIDCACSSYVPLVRYEDMLENPVSAATRVLNAWRVDCDAEAIAIACANWSAESLRARPPIGDDRLARMFGAGHLRRAVSGGWRDELPPLIARDIAARFHDYQERLGYASVDDPPTGA